MKAVPLLFVAGAAVIVLLIAVLSTRALLRMPADAPPAAELVGSLGTVVTPIAPDGPGEISLTTAGQQLKLEAHADNPVTEGTTVVVIDVTSPTSVVVAESGF